MNHGVQAIGYGMFIMPFHDPAKPPAQCYDEDLELIVQAEELGFTEFWIGEHHTMKYENIVMPEIFIARALPRTAFYSGCGLRRTAQRRAAWGAWDAEGAGGSIGLLPGR